MKRKLYIGVIIAVMLVIIAVPVLGAYYVNITVTETNGTDRAQNPIVFSMDVEYLADHNFIRDDGLDIRVQNSVGNNMPFLPADDKIIFCSDIEADHGTTFQFTTGNTPLSNFDIAVGSSGYITVSDHANLELGNDFEIEFDAWIDTTLGEIYLYNEGELEDDWVEGYSIRSPTYSKESDHLKIIAYDWDLSEEGTYVTDSAVNLSGVRTLKIDWENTGEDHEQNLAFFVVSTVKDGPASTYDVRVARNRDFSRTWDELDVSDLTGSYYIRVHAQDGTTSDNHAESNVRTYNVVAEGGYLVFKLDAFHICVEEGELIGYIDGGTPKSVSYTVPSTNGYGIKVYADTTNLKLDINGETEDTEALSGVSVPDNANDWELTPSPYFENYHHTTSDTARITYEPDEYISGTTLPNSLNPGTYDGVITWGTTATGLSVTSSLLETDDAYVYGGVEPGSEDIIAPETTPLISDVDLDQLEDNPFNPLVEATAESMNLTERLAWICGAFLILIVVVGVVLIKTKGHLFITSLIGLGLSAVFYSMGIFDYWVLILFGLGAGVSVLYERKPTL